MKLTPSALLAVALAVARPWQHGRGPASLRGIESDLNVPRPFVCSLVDRLTVAGILCPVGPHEVPPADEYTLARPAEKIDILEVLSIESAPDDARLDELYCDEIRQRVQEVRRLVREKVGSISLASLVRGE
jgi:DNA-binding IscR family transcriptional regulator